MYYDLKELLRPSVNPPPDHRGLTDTDRVRGIREMMSHPRYSALWHSSARLTMLLGESRIMRRELYGVEVVLDDTKRLKELRTILLPLLYPEY
jgi:hypothetical protein